ncbi:MAG: hypothetical protein IT557_03980 [Alphaproteobacteria bacterium]|nr:hypothetical protein [Alphaproteobacteria bacterium]
MSSRSILSRRLFLAATAAAALPGQAGAQGGAAFPSKPVEILIGVAPGGGVDRSVRLIGPPWAEAMGGRHPITYTSMPGASGVLAMLHMLRARPDGHTLMYFPIPHIAWEFTLNKVRGHRYQDITWLGALFSDPNVFLVKKDARWNRLDEFIDESKRSPRPFTISVSTPMSAAHAATVLLRERTGANLKAVPFGGGGPARNAVAGGHVDGCIAPYWSAINALTLTKAIGIFQDRNPAPNLWQPLPVNQMLSTPIPHLEEPYAMFCATAVKQQNPAVYERLVSTLTTATKSAGFRSVADREQLAPFLVDMDGAACDKFMGDYIKLVESLRPAMERDLRDM